MPTNDTTETQQVTEPSHRLIAYIVISSLLSVILFLLALWCPLNIGKDQIEKPGAPTHRQAFFLTTVTMFVAGMAGGCLSNIRRIIQHTAPGLFDRSHSLSYYLRPLYGGVAGIIVFFLLLGSAITFNVGSAVTSETTEAWMTLTGRAPYIAFGLLAGYGSKEFTNKLADLADSLFALSKKNNGS